MQNGLVVLSDTSVNNFGITVTNLPLQLLTDDALYYISFHYDKS